MAVVNAYINDDIVAGNLAKPNEFSGANVLAITATFDVAAADDDGSKYRIARVNSNLVPLNFVVTNDAITGGTDYDIGLYHTLEGPDAGAVITGGKDVFADGLDLSSAVAEGSGVSGLSNVDVADAQKTLWELAGDTQAAHPGQYDIVVTANTVGSAAGDVTVKMYFTQG